MAHINLTLTQEEILALLSENRDEAFRQLFQGCLNSILQAESAEQLGAARYERTDARTDSRNGTRVRSLQTRIAESLYRFPGTETSRSKRCFLTIIPAARPLFLPPWRRWSLTVFLRERSPTWLKRYVERKFPSLPFPRSVRLWMMKSVNFAAGH